MHVESEQCMPHLIHEPLSFTWGYNVPLMSFGLLMKDSDKDQTAKLYPVCMLIQYMGLTLQALRQEFAVHRPRIESVTYTLLTAN
jgi:hypothetical protein